MEADLAGTELVKMGTVEEKLERSMGRLILGHYKFDFFSEWKFLAGY